MAEPSPRSRARSRRRAAGRGRGGGFQVTFRIPGRVSIGASEGAKSCASRPLRSRPISPSASVPVLDPTAFLEASFKQAEDAPLLPGRVVIYRDGVFVGRGKIAAAGKDETVRLGFGADDKVKIERTVVKRNEGSAGLIVTTSKTDERAFNTTVRNGHDFPIGSRSRTSCRSARTRTSWSRCCPQARRRPRPICATGAACWNGRSRPRRRSPRHQFCLARPLAQGQGRRDGPGGVRVTLAATTLLRHAPPPGLASGEPDDRLRSGHPVIRAACRAHNWRRGVLDRPVKPGDDGRSGERE